MIWGGRYIKFIVGLNPTRLDSSVVRASGICPEGLGSIPSLVTFLYSNREMALSLIAAAAVMITPLSPCPGCTYSIRYHHLVNC